MSITLTSNGAGGWSCKNDKGQTVFQFNFTNYPGCCLLGIIHDFYYPAAYGAEATEEKKQIQKQLLTLLDRMGVNEVLLADTSDGAGYALVHDMEAANAINVSFNANSGNFVYLFSIYKERG